MLKPAVFLDRDGVLVRPVMRNGVACSPRRWEEFGLMPGCAEAVRKLREGGYVVVVVTNQPEVRRGTLDPALLEQFHNRLRQEVPVDDVVVCPHDDQDGCLCRKPKPGMIRDAAGRHDIDLNRSYMVGDTVRDLGASIAAGVSFLLIDAPYNRDLEARRVGDLGEAARVILNHTARP
jgi:D-glycero-D-manno-heptose 1,7-bisphosphate phosphatase